MMPDYRPSLQPEKSDEAFVQLCYRRLFGREPDEGGRITNLAALQHGMSRFDVIVGFVTSAEYYTVLTKSIFGEFELPRLQEIRPANFEAVRFASSEQTAMTFRVQDPKDHDWLEEMIVEHGYYEKPGVWSLAIDRDKQVIAEIISHFSARRCLELGCATGSVLKLLLQAGVEAEGVEISHMALALAYPEIRKRIHFGDLLKLDLKKDYDVIVGMDIFEHLNPNKISEYVKRCFSLLSKGGFLFTNLPAFGADKIFGEVFPPYLEAWRTEAAKDTLFSVLHVDDRGWPLNGHLIWTTPGWWQGIFEQAGFVREIKIEQALHDVYDPFFVSSAPARKSFFVFSKEAKSARTDQIANSIRQKRSSCV
jgi:2-polyprenyl-3-methyl-5-hydroxy-6-metoxy-1,4-benzoquinol methylase